MLAKIEKEDLHTASYNEAIELVQRLLVHAKPSAINKKLTNYKTPINGTLLHIVCRSGNLEIVKLLVEAGANNS